MQTTKLAAVLCLFGLAVCLPSSRGAGDPIVHGVYRSGDSGAPLATLAGMPSVPFKDNRPTLLNIGTDQLPMHVYNYVQDVPSPVSPFAPVFFDRPLLLLGVETAQHTSSGLLDGQFGWGRGPDWWGHGYTGSVYYNADNKAYYKDGSDSVTLFLPGQTSGFTLFVQMASGQEMVSALAEFGGAVGSHYAHVLVAPVKVEQPVTSDKGDAVGFSFASTSDGLYLQQITVSSETGDFGLGDFRITPAPVPEPAAYGLLAAGGLLGLAVFRRFRRNRRADG